MLPASHKAAGLSYGFPDVCLTPVGPVIVPIPYPNFGAHAMAVVFSPVVQVAMMPALNLASILAMTTGDAPGVAHWTILGIGQFVLGNPVVFVEKLPAISLTSLTMGNNGNCPTDMVVAPGAPNVLYTFQRAEMAGGAASPHPPPPVGFARRVAPEARRSMAEALAGPPLSIRDVRRPPAPPGSVNEQGVGVLEVHCFSLALPAALHAALAAMRGEGLSALVVDLRGCPGGELLSFVALCSDFLPAGAEIATLVDADGDETPYRSRNDTPLDLPLFLVVDAGTASAAEMFAGCLKAHGRAVLVGERTHGKGSAQAFFGDSAGTVARVKLPSGTDIEGHGIRPDHSAMSGDALSTAIGLAGQARKELR